MRNLNKLGLLFTLCFALVLCGCAKENNAASKSSSSCAASSFVTSSSEKSEDVKALAYECFSAEMQNHIKNGWDSGTVTTILLKSGMADLENEDYLNKEVYCVEFPTELESGNTAVFMSQDTLEFIGFRYND